jgi:hypothetical protein
MCLMQTAFNFLSRWPPSLTFDPLYQGNGVIIRRPLITKWSGTEGGDFAPFTISGKDEDMLRSASKPSKSPVLDMYNCRRNMLAVLVSRLFFQPSLPNSCPTIIAILYTGLIQTLRYILLRRSDKQQCHDQSINSYHLLSVFSPLSSIEFLNTHPKPQQKSTSSSSPQTFLVAAPSL